MTSSRRRALMGSSAALLAAGLLALTAPAASAHVRVVPANPVAGGYSQLTFSVPNESATAKTNSIEVSLPTETPLTSVSVRPMDGWTATVTTSDLPAPVTMNGATITKAPSSVKWTADEAHQIGPNEYQQFAISVGVLPDAGTTLVLPTVQTYTDGEVATWDEAAVEGQPEPENPAPSFVTEAAAPTAAEPAATPESSNKTGTPAVAWWGLAAGLVGLGAGITALIRSRPATAAPRSTGK